ncbi:MAG: T9SS type A sorting domain-containing protein [Bacteroidetes bacterium]|nr:T9SS type A sorting domain-containing protein [Bacteroidota bacterium]
MPKKQNVKISVFNSLGQQVNVLVNEVKDAGKYQYVFSGKNLPSGIYFYRIETKDFSETKRMVLVK